MSPPRRSAGRTGRSARHQARPAAALQQVVRPLEEVVHNAVANIRTLNDEAIASLEWARDNFGVADLGQAVISNSIAHLRSRNVVVLSLANQVRIPDQQFRDAYHYPATTRVAWAFLGPYDGQPYDFGAHNSALSLIAGGQRALILRPGFNFRARRAPGLFAHEINHLITYPTPTPGSPRRLGYEIRANMIQIHLGDERGTPADSELRLPGTIRQVIDSMRASRMYPELMPHYDRPGPSRVALDALIEQGWGPHWGNIDNH